MPKQPTAAAPWTLLPPPVTEAEGGSGEETRAPLAAYHRAFLHEMLEIGADLLRVLNHEAKARFLAIDAAKPTATSPASNIAIAFDRITRAMRRSIALDRTLDEQPVEARPIRSPAEPRPDARPAILREVEDIIRDTAEESDAKALRHDLHDRLDTLDLEDELHNRPVADIIREICTGLGLDDVNGASLSGRRTPADEARLRAPDGRSGRILGPARGAIFSPSSPHDLPPAEQQDRQHDRQRRHRGDGRIDGEPQIVPHPPRQRDRAAARQEQRHHQLVERGDEREQGADQHARPDQRQGHPPKSF
jgi:hypothetical protein